MNVFRDTKTMTGRVMKHTLRSVDTLITVVVMPVMIMLASIYIYGSAMHIENSSYVNYVVPGILLLTIASGSAYTTYRLNQDITNGIFERFYTMPIAKSSILGGHVYTSVIYNLVSVLAVIIAAMLFGYRSTASFQNLLLACLLIIAFNFAITWIAIFFGLLAKNAESASLFSYLIMALIFVSSAFAPTNTMKSGLKVFANANPFTWVIDGLRDLLSQNSLTNSFWLGIGFSLALWLIFQICALILYQRKLH